MTTEDLKNSNSLTTVGDGFDGYSDRVEGDNSTQQPQGLIRGNHLKFGATAQWERREGETIGPDVKLIVTDIKRAVLKWGPNKNDRPETTIIPPGEPFPDVEAMNEAVPKDQWRQGPAGLQGPYQSQQAVVLLEPRSMEEFTFTTSSIGGFICVRELVDKVKTMRRYRGPVSPIVTLGDVPMRTRFGERRRPHFNIVDWVRMEGGGEPQQPALPAPSPDSGVAPIIEVEPVKVEPSPVIEAEPVKAEPAAAAKPAKRSRRSNSLYRLAPLTINEELDDEIPIL
jgi:hypothetical protein